MKRASKAKGDAYWNILSFAVRCLSFMIPTPAVTREIITTYMQSLVIEGARLMKESGRFHSDVLEGMSFLAPENHAIIVDTSEKLFLEIIKGGDLFEICVVLEICELLTGPFGGGIREWINVADNVFDQCADLLEVLLPNSRFLCERMLWRKKISIESVIRRHAIDSISLPTIRSVFNVAYASHFESLRRGTLYNKVQDIKLEKYHIRYYTNLLKPLERPLLSLSPFKVTNLGLFAQKHILRWVALPPLNADERMLDLEPDALFVLFVIFAIALELCSSSDLPPILENIKQAPHPFYTLIHYIFLARFEQVPAEKVQAEMDARGFSPEQQFIWQWVRHEKNFIERVESDTSTDAAVIP